MWFAVIGAASFALSIVRYFTFILKISYFFINKIQMSFWIISGEN